jgi:CRISPR-associated protein Csa3
MSKIKVLILSLGFDERFAIRGILRAGLSNNDKIIIFIAEPIVEKSEKALQIIMDFLKKYFEKIKVDVIPIPTKDFEQSALIIGEKLMNYRNSDYEIILNLSGGMRSLILELLMASLILDIKGIIEIELENLEGYISFPIEMLKIKIPLKDEYRRILKEIIENEGINLSQLSKKANIAKSTVHKIIKKLIEYKLIEYEKIGKEYRFKAKRIAKLFVK